MSYRQLPNRNESTPEYAIFSSHGVRPKRSEGGAFIIGSRTAGEAEYTSDRRGIRDARLDVDLAIHGDLVRCYCGLKRAEAQVKNLGAVPQVEAICLSPHSEQQWSLSDRENDLMSPCSRIPESVHQIGGRALQVKLIRDALIHEEPSRASEGHHSYTVAFSKTDETGLLGGACVLVLLKLGWLSAEKEASR